MTISGLIKQLFVDKNGQPIDPQNLTRDNVLSIIHTLINWSFAVVGGVVLIYLIIGGYYLLTSSGNEDQVKKGKDTIKSAIIGLIVVLAAWALVVFILRWLGAVPAEGA